VESSCKLGNEPSGSIKCWELLNGCTTCGLLSGTQLHRVSYDEPFMKSRTAVKFTVQQFKICRQYECTPVCSSGSNLQMAI
jgi:hypothetical protein